jgi:5-methylcytosine-specific restriction endonuclease McrA
MMAVVEESPDYFQDILTRAAHNKKHEHNYIEAISQLPPPVTQETYSSCGVPYGLYRTIEKRLVRKLQIKAFPEEPEFRVTAYYTSPAGRNHYRKEQCFTCEDIQQMLDAFESNLEKTAYKQHQRSLMSAGLRYDIMKRDNFRCVICGRSAQDGVTLQVDHIIPVAKGGQTEPENLRTLCEDCNRGKSDKL